jgi:hypothetical protein
MLRFEQEALAITGVNGPPLAFAICIWMQFRISSKILFKNLNRRFAAAHP